MMEADRAETDSLLEFLGAIKKGDKYDNTICRCPGQSKLFFFKVDDFNNRKCNNKAKFMWKKCCSIEKSLKQNIREKYYTRVQRCKVV